MRIRSGLKSHFGKIGLTCFPKMEMSNVSNGGGEGRGGRGCR